MPKIFILIGAIVAAGWLFFFSLKNEPTFRNIDISKYPKSTDSQVFLGQINRLEVEPSASSSPGPTPAPASTPSLTPTPEPTPSSLDSSGSMATPSPSTTSSPKATKTPVPITSTASSVPTPTPTAVPTQTPESLSPVIINEVAWMGTQANAADEWLELYNPNSTAVNISGWILKSATDNKPNIIFSDGASIPAHSYYLIERTDDSTVSDIAAELIVAFGSGAGAGLGNSGETLELFDSGGNLQDRVVSNGSWLGGDNTTKSTMERGTDSNWVTNNGSTRNGLDAELNYINGTPKAKNSMTP